MDTSQVRTLPPPKSDLEKLQDALEILNRLGCEYEIKLRQTTYTRRMEEV